MENNILPTISKEQLKQDKNSGLKSYDFLCSIINHYLKYISHHKNPELAIGSFSDEQHALLGYNYLYIQVGLGGFLELIKNGYGLYIFETPFSQNILKFGAGELSCIVNEAKKVYEKCKLAMESLSEEEFCKKEDEFAKEFARIDAKFYSAIENQTQIIKDYVIKNIEKFAIVE